MASINGISQGRTRLAPTPSGFLHAGNAFNFLLTARLASATRSTLVLRIDDLDTERTRPEYVEDIFRSLEWLGIEVNEGPSGPDEFAEHWSQSLRVQRYAEHADVLKQMGALYACACSRTRMDAQRMDGCEHICRSVQNKTAGPFDAWRLRIPRPAPVHLLGITGPDLTVDLADELEDPVLLQRESGRPAYQLASLVDDLEMGITFVVRGMDLLPSTACQVYLAQLLGFNRFGTVRFHHHPLTLGTDGSKLSKSAGASSLKVLRDTGRDPSDLYRLVDRYLVSAFGFSV